MPTLTPPCKLVRDDLTLWSATCLWLDCDSLHSKSDCVVLITGSPSGYTPGRPEFPEALSSFCLLIKMWQLAKAQGVTRNEPKILVICYITPNLSCYLPKNRSKTEWFIPFPSVLALCKMHIACSRFEITGFISRSNNRYTMSTDNKQSVTFSDIRSSHLWINLAFRARQCSTYFFSFCKWYQIVYHT